MNQLISLYYIDRLQHCSHTHYDNAFYCLYCIQAALTHRSNGHLTVTGTVHQQDSAVQCSAEKECMRMRMRAALLSRTLNTNGVCVDSTDETALVALYELHDHTHNEALTPIPYHTIPYHTIQYNPYNNTIITAPQYAS